MARQNDHVGFFKLNNAAELPRPRIDNTLVLQLTTTGGRTAGHLYLYKGAGAWSEYAPVALSALTAAPAAAPAGGTGAAAGGWDTAGNRDSAIRTINYTRTRVGEIEARLKTFGLLPP